MRAASLALVVLVLLLPLGLSDYRAYQLALYFLYAAAATGIGLCWGRAGFLPLGQAMFFGLAAYLAGLMLIWLGDSIWVFVLLPLAAAAAGLLAYAIGFLVFRRQGESGPYFSMITLALSLLAFQVATSWNGVTGGFNGLKGIPGLPGLDDFSAAYYVSATAWLIVLGLGAWLYSAPIGVLWRALAQNERRVALFGFNTNALKAVAFGVSGLFAGIGGAIYAPQQGLVTPQVAGFRALCRPCDLGRGRRSFRPARTDHWSAAGRRTHHRASRPHRLLGSADGGLLHPGGAGLSARPDRRGVRR